jgi:hypothetical protein
VDIRPTSTAELNLLTHVVNGIGLGLILHQRGVFTLHASVAAIGNQAVAFAGAKLSGKSTLAATLATRGHSVMSDDVAAIGLSGNATPYVWPGPPNLNLWPDAIATTGQDPAALPRIWSGNEKRVLVKPSNRARAPLTLGAVIILAVEPDAELPKLERLRGVAAFA